MASPAPLSERQRSRCFERAEAARWRVSLETFGEALAAGTSKWLGDRQPAPDAVDRFLDGLHLADLALACACAAGDEAAWEHFVLTYRPVLYRAADALDPSGGARELADGLYADLYGSPDADGRRRSLFRYFHGRSSLATWLRAVLSQRHVDQVRTTRRLTELPDADALPDRPGPPIAPTTERSRFVALIREALAGAIAALAPRDRLRLACYYGEDMTLAEIGRAIGEHEATVSRHLARTRRTIRDQVTRGLLARGLSESAVAEGFQSVVDDAGSLDLADWLGSEASRKNLTGDRSTS